MDVSEVADAVRALLTACAHRTAEPHEGRRPMVGIAGPPGGGKTTLARALAAELGFAHAPGDGFIIGTTFTDAAGRLHDRGTVTGFDTDAYAACLADVAEAFGTRDVLVPSYRHTVEGGAAGAGDDALTVPASAPGVATECNFLGSPTDGWPEVRAHLDVLIYLDESWATCRPRLLARQLAKGRTDAEAAERVDSHDLANFREAAAHGPAAASFTLQWDDARARLA